MLHPDDNEEDEQSKKHGDNRGMANISETFKPSLSPGQTNFINMMSAKERENESWKKRLDITDFKTIRNTFRLDPDIKLHEKDWELLYNQHCHKNSYANYNPQSSKKDASQPYFEDDLKDIDKYRKMVEHEQKYQFYDETNFSTTYHIDQVLTWASDEDIRILTKLWFNQAIQGAAIFFPTNRTELFLYQIRQSLAYRLFVDATVIFLLLSPTIMPHQCLENEHNRESTIISASVFIILCCLMQFLDVYISYRTTHWTKMKDSDIKRSFFRNYFFPYDPSNHILFDHNLNWQRVRCVTALFIILNSIAHMAQRDIPNLCRIATPLLLIARREDLKQLLHGMYYASKKVSRLIRLAVLFVFAWAFLGFCFLRRYSVGSVSDEVRFSTFSQALYACLHCMLSRPTVLYRLKPIFLENNYSSFYFVILTVLGDIMLTTIIISMGTRAFRKFSLQNMEGRLKYRHVAIHSLFRLYTKRYPGDSKYNRITIVSCDESETTVERPSDPWSQSARIASLSDNKERKSNLNSTLDSIKDKYYVDYAMNRACWLTFVDNLDETFKIGAIKNSILVFYLEACRKENSAMTNTDVTESDVGGLIYERSFFRLCGLLSCRLKFFTDSLFLTDRRSSYKTDPSAMSFSSSPTGFNSRMMSDESNQNKNTLSWCFVAASQVLHNWYKAVRYHPQLMAYHEAFQQRVFNAFYYVIIFYYPSSCDWFVEKCVGPVVHFFFYQSQAQVKGEWRLRIFHVFQFTLYFLSILQTCLLANAHVDIGVVVFQWFVLFFFVMENQILSNVRIDISLFEVRATALINLASFIALCALSASLPASRTSSSYTDINDNALTAVLIIESVRYIKVIISSKPFQSVASIIPVIGRAVFLYVLILYSFALLGHITLCQKMHTSAIASNVDDDSGGWVPFAKFLNFNSIYSSYYTVAASAVLSNWSMIMDSAVASTHPPQQAWVYIYFYFLRFCTVVIVIPLLLSCVIQAFIQFLDKRAADKQALLNHEKEQKQKEQERENAVRKSLGPNDARISNLVQQITAANGGIDAVENDGSSSFALSDIGEDIIPRKSVSIAFGRDIMQTTSKRTRIKTAIVAKDRLDEEDKEDKPSVQEAAEDPEEWSDIRITTTQNNVSEDAASQRSRSRASAASSTVPAKPKRLLTRTSILGLDYYHLTSLLSHNNLDIEDPIASLWSPNGRACVQYHQVRSPLELRYAHVSMVSASRQHQRLDQVLDHIENRLFSLEALLHSKLRKLRETLNKGKQDTSGESNTPESKIRMERFEVHDSLVIDKLKSWMKDFKEFDNISKNETVESESLMVSDLTRDKLRQDFLKQVQATMPKEDYPILASNWFTETINGRGLFYPTTSSQLSHLLILRSSWFMILVGVVVVFQMFAIFLVVPKCTIKTVDDPSESTISHQALNIIDICCCIIYLFEIYLDGYTNYNTYQHILHSLSTFDEFQSVSGVSQNQNTLWQKAKQLGYKFAAIAQHGYAIRIAVVLLIVAKSLYSIQKPESTMSNVRLIRGVFPYLVLSHYPHFTDILFGLKTSFVRSRMVYILFGSIVILFSIIGFFQFHRYPTHAGRFDQLGTAFLTILQCSTSAPFSLYVVLPYFETVSQLTPLFFLTLTYITEVLCISLIVGAGNVYFSKYGATVLARRRKSRYESLMQIFQLLAIKEKSETAVPLEMFKQFVKHLPQKYQIPENEIPRLLAYVRRGYGPLPTDTNVQHRLSKAEFYCMVGCIYRGITLCKVLPGETLDTLYNGMVNFDHSYYFGKESIISISEMPIQGGALTLNMDSSMRWRPTVGGIELVSSPLHQQFQEEFNENYGNQLPDDDIADTIEEETEKTSKRQAKSKSALVKTSKEEKNLPNESTISIHDHTQSLVSRGTFTHEGKSLFTAEEEDVYIVVIKDDDRTSYVIDFFPPNAMLQYPWLQKIVDICHALVYTSFHVYSKPPITLTMTLIDIFGFFINILLIVQLIYYTSLKYCSYSWAAFGYFLEFCIFVELFIRMIGIGDRHFFVYENIHTIRFLLAIFILGCMISLGKRYRHNSTNIPTAYLMLVVAQCLNLIFGILSIRPHTHNAELLKKESLIVPVNNPAAINVANANQAANFVVIKQQSSANTASNPSLSTSDDLRPSVAARMDSITIQSSKRRNDYSATMQIYHNHYVRSGISNNMANRRFKLSIENTCRSLLLLLIILYFYTIIAQDSFCGILNPNDVVGSPTNDDDASAWNNFGNILNFNNYPQTIFTLFEVTVLGSWSIVMDAVLYNYPGHQFSGYAFFFVFRLSMTLIFVPLLMSFMVRSFISLHDQISFVHKRRKKFLNLAKRQRQENGKERNAGNHDGTRSMPTSSTDSSQSGWSTAAVGRLTDPKLASTPATSQTSSIKAWCQALIEGKFLHYYPPPVIKYQTFAPYLDIWDTTALHDSDIITVQDPVFIKTLLAVENAGWKLKQYIAFLKEVDLDACFETAEEKQMLKDLIELVEETEMNVIKECDKVSSLNV